MIVENLGDRTDIYIEIFIGIEGNELADNQTELLVPLSE